MIEQRCPDLLKEMDNRSRMEVLNVDVVESAEPVFVDVGTESCLEGHIVDSVGTKTVRERKKES